MATTPSPTTKFHQPIREFMNKLVNRDSKALPRKLASTPFAASLLSPLAPDEASKRRLQLQRIADIVVLDATRDKKNQLVITLKLSLKPETLREQVRIFVPNLSAVVYEITKTFHDVNQLRRVLSYCVDKATGDCDENCEFCSKLHVYLRNHWVNGPLMAVGNMGETVLRKTLLAMHLVQLVAMTTGAAVAVPRTATIPTDKGAPVVQLLSKLSPLGQTSENKMAAFCKTQNEVAAVLYDFLDMFTQTPKTTTTVFITEL